MLPSRKYYLDSIFDNFIEDNTRLDIIKCDIYEKDNSYYIEADIPGFKKNEISVECEDGYVTIIAEKDINNEQSDGNKNYIKRERYYDKTIRKFYVGDIDSDKIQAKFVDGVLELIVPKQEKLSTKKSIEVK